MTRLDFVDLLDSKLWKASNYYPALNIADALDPEKLKAFQAFLLLLPRVHMTRSTTADEAQDKQILDYLDALVWEAGP